MTRDDIKRNIASWIAATKRAEQAGFDVIEIHAAHGMGADCDD
jgi:2,4-dienoyl-CoA reductase-like NADH-dependent reductase (Old Yellow Enzyme family)